jgi:prepilin-type N-terminal cleavage/methylation domain-containing protein
VIVRAYIRNSRGGFTLLELLAAMAVGAVVLAGLAGLIRNVGLTFEAGTRGVGNAERLLLAVERLAGDFASVRYLQKSADESVRAVFIGGPKKVAFVSAAGVAANLSGEEVVILEVEESGELSRLVRRRSRWLGARTPLAEVKPTDPVVLIEGRLQIAFAYADQALVWKDRWVDAPDLPRFVRLLMRDKTTGATTFGFPDFPIRSDAPPACSKPDATPACIAASPPQNQATQSQPAREQRSTRP